MNDIEIIETLIEAAGRGFKSSTGTFRLGVLILHPKGRICGFNRLKTHPKSPHPYKSIHAEFDAIHRAIILGIDIRKAKLFVGRRRKDGNFGKARPCESCQKFIDGSGIGKVYWSEPSGYGFRIRTGGVVSDGIRILSGP